MEETKKLYKIVAQNDQCVLLKRLDSETYKIKDRENDDVYFGHNYECAMKIFNSYDLDKIRKEKREMFEKWLLDFAEAE